jgi:UDP-2,3-diacylglucosamine pyrophosphatase LpxH
MKTLLIGDLHLKAQLILPLVDNIIKKHNVKRIILLGDYVDLHGQNQNVRLYAKDLTYLFSWKQKHERNGLEVINLVGNHDVYYLLGQPAPFSVKNLELFFAVQNLLESLNLQIAYQLDDYLISHAGYNFLFDPVPWHFEPITEAHEKKLEIFAYAVGSMRGGGDLAGSPLWADFREIELAPNENYPKQIVGHTPQKSIDISKNVIGIDTFSLYLDKQNEYQFIGNGDLLIYDEGKFEVISTSWTSSETLKQLPQPLT